MKPISPAADGRSQQSKEAQTSMGLHEPQLSTVSDSEVSWTANASRLENGDPGGMGSVWGEKEVCMMQLYFNLKSLNGYMKSINEKWETPNGPPSLLKEDIK